MKLQTLKPKLKAIDTRAVKVLEAKAGTTERIRGRTWMATRQRIAKAYNYTCVDCGLIWRSHIDQIDHDVPLEQGGSNDDSNLKLRCNACHKDKTRAERKDKGVYIKDLIHPIDIYPSKIPLTIVCGPAAGGKSTYIKQNMVDGDYLIDMDEIRARLGIDDNDWTTDTLQRSLTHRNAMLRALTTVQARHAWFIVSAPTDNERRWWNAKLNPERIVIVSATLDTCLTRIASTRQRHRAKRSTEATAKWWNEYTNTSKHEVIDTST